MQINFQMNRPSKNPTPSDKRLEKIYQKIFKFLQTSNYQVLSGYSITEKSMLAAVVTEFAEDTWFEIGMWRSVERFNEATFGNPLPFAKPDSVEYSDYPFDEYRIHYLLWNTILIMIPDSYIPAYHLDLFTLAEDVSKLLERAFNKPPRTSTVKVFLKKVQTESAYSIKRRLVWLGGKSYLFRWACVQYLMEQKGVNTDNSAKIAVYDDFICQQTTYWSGLGIIDIGATILGLNEEQQAQVKSWYERHLAWYLVEQDNGSKTTLRNLLNNEKYVAYQELEPNERSRFREGNVVIGSLVPYGDAWSWSGVQYEAGEYIPEEITSRLVDFYKRNYQAVYRYAPKFVEQARKNMIKQNEYFCEFHGDNLAVYPNGKKMAEKEAERYNWIQQRIIEDNPKAKESPAETRKFKAEDLYSEDTANLAGGIAMFHNREQGEEIIIHYDDVQAALKSKLLDEKQCDTLRDIVMTEEISREFIYRTIEQYGSDNYFASFHLPEQPDYWLEYLLRKFKGEDYRRRFPRLALIRPDGEGILPVS